MMEKGRGGRNLTKSVKNGGVLKLTKLGGLKWANC